MIFTYYFNKFRAVKNLIVLLLTILIFTSCKVSLEPTRQQTQTPPVLLISIDGLRPDYISKTATPTFDTLINQGALADHLIPVFPSKTFPNHYSMVTGLYAENSGIIANNMVDPQIKEKYSLGNRKAVEDPRWYLGEPIWVTAEKQNKTAATLFWPGSEAPIKGIQATYWLPYNHNLEHNARVDTLINWFEKNPKNKPQFATFYLSQVDTYGHRYGPNSDSIHTAVREVDRTLAYLIQELKRIKLWPDINIIITSDHGMAEVSSEKSIVIDEIIDLKEVTMIDWNPVAMIQPHHQKTTKIYNALKKSEKNYQVYLKKDLPERFKLKNNPRVPEIILIADNGYTVITRKRLEEKGIQGGAHGYDNLHPDMRAFFLAWGPSFKENYQSPAFKSIHIYELLCKLLAIKPAPNDGKPNSLNHLLKNK